MSDYIPYIFVITCLYMLRYKTKSRTVCSFFEWCSLPEEITLLTFPHKYHQIMNFRYSVNTILGKRDNIYSKHNAKNSNVKNLLTKQLK